MSKIRKILRMNSQGRSTRFIAAQIESSRNTVRKYLAVLKKSGFTFEEVNNLNDKELEDLFGKTRETTSQAAVCNPCCAAFHTLIKSSKDRDEPAAPVGSLYQRVSRRL
ncbi:HTH domain-containing protein [Mucilaginibacter rubeus]|uniref:HTH domain-containing protein n=1 Tax=Mucilaginibacter rubeus TaxID=2027860 RepID=UPI001FB7AF88|nr:HTH domain-containing protein [Mucilaginibacter rubeus]